MICEDLSVILRYTYYVSFSSYTKHSLYYKDYYVYNQ